MSKKLNHVYYYLILTRRLARSLKMSTRHFLNTPPSKEFYHWLMVGHNEAQHVLCIILVAWLAKLK